MYGPSTKQNAPVQVAAVILAGGASSRFGSPKRDAPIDDGSMLDLVVRAAERAGLRPILVVAPGAAHLPPPATLVPNDDPGAGLSHSLRLGLRAVPAAAAAAMVLLADQPTVGTGLLRRLVASRGGRSIVATTAAGRSGPPLLIERSAFSLAEEATGDAGLRDLLHSRPQLVEPVEVLRHPPDVDTRDDLAAIAERCTGCGARLPAVEATVTHEYIGASPACWVAFGELLAREFQDPAYGRIHRHTVDVYAVQHPGIDDRRQRQSVALHLIALCHWLEHDLPMERLNPITQRLASGRADWPWLTPPTEYELTVLDVLAATDGDQHVRFVRSWGESTWNAWEPHHGLIRRWAAEALR